jgi:hypothetical protein
LPSLTEKHNIREETGAWNEANILLPLREKPTIVVTEAQEVDEDILPSLMEKHNIGETEGTG